MENYICTVCGYVYNPEENDGIKFEDLPDDYVCPLCRRLGDLLDAEQHFIRYSTEIYYV